MYCIVGVDSLEAHGRTQRREAHISELVHGRAFKAWNRLASDAYGRGIVHCDLDSVRRRVISHIARAITRTFFPTARECCIQLGVRRFRMSLL